jgi:RNA polymerase sigma-70 factor (ECF subfamily)
MLSSNRDIQDSDCECKHTAEDSDNGREGITKMEAASSLFRLGSGTTQDRREEIAASGHSGPLEVLSAEQALVRDLQRGDRQAFASLLAEHQQAVYGYLRARSLDFMHAEDATQEVFLRCYMQRERLDRGTTIRGWLLGIARNVLLEHLRKVKRSREQAWTELCLELDELVTQPTISPLERHGNQDPAALLPVCLDSLGQSARASLEMHYRSGLRLNEIAVKLKRSEGAVKLLMFRARQALKHCLRTRMEQESS